MRGLPGLSLMLAAACAVPAPAAVTLLARGSLGGTSDLSGLTNTLENGLPANILGGLGSGLAYAGGNSFLALPDRGPNATPYNSAVDDTASYIARFQSITMQLAAGSGGYTLTPTLTATTLLSSPTALVYGTGTNPTTGADLGNRYDGTPLGSGAPAQNTPTAFYFTGRSDNYGVGGAGGSGDPLNARLDPESIRVSNDGRSVFVSDEYGPYVRQFDRATGQLIRTFALPANLDVATLSPNGATEISGNTSGRVANKGMEGLAITPDGKTLVGIMQQALIQDTPASGNGPLRIVTIDIATGTTHEYAYNLTSGTGVSDIVAINDHQFLVDERDGKGLGDGSSAKVKQIFRIDLTGATDVTNLSGSAALAAVAVTKNTTPFIDLVSALGAVGITATQVPSKIEGLAFGQDLTIGGVLTHTLYISNDNDFTPATSGPNQFFVFGFTDADLPGYVAQALPAVPEPATWATMVAGFGLLGTALRRHRPRTGVRFG